MRDHLAGLDATHVSYSELNTLAQCEQKWYENYVNRQQGAPSNAMKFGTTIHKMVEGWWADDANLVGAYVAASVEEVTLPDSGKHSYEDADWLMSRYDEVYQPWKDAGWHRPDWSHGELSLDADLVVAHGLVINVRVTPDDFLVDPDGLLVLVERKTMGSWQRLDLVDVTPQETIQVWAARANGMEVNRVGFDAIKSYRWTRDKHPAEDSFQFIETYRDDDQVEGGLNWMRSVLLRRQDLLANRGNVQRSPVRNISKDCRYCPYQDLCWTELSFPMRGDFVVDDEDD